MATSTQVPNGSPATTSATAAAITAAASAGVAPTTAAAAITAAASAGVAPTTIVSTDGEDIIDVIKTTDDYTKSGDTDGRPIRWVYFESSGHHIEKHPWNNVPRSPTARKDIVKAVKELNDLLTEYKIPYGSAAYNTASDTVSVKGLWTAPTYEERWPLSTTTLNCTVRYCNGDVIRGITALLKMLYKIYELTTVKIKITGSIKGNNRGDGIPGVLITVGGQTKQVDDEYIDLLATPLHRTDGRINITESDRQEAWDKFTERPEPKAKAKGKRGSAAKTRKSKKARTDTDADTTEKPKKTNKKKKTKAKKAAASASADGDGDGDTKVELTEITISDGETETEPETESSVSAQTASSSSSSSSASAGAVATMSSSSSSSSGTLASSAVAATKAPTKANRPRPFNLKLAREAYLSTCSAALDGFVSSTTDELTQLKKALKTITAARQASELALNGSRERLSDLESTIQFHVSCKADADKRETQLKAQVEELTAKLVDVKKTLSATVLSDAASMAQLTERCNVAEAKNAAALKELETAYVALSEQRIASEAARKSVEQSKADLVAAASDKVKALNDLYNIQAELVSSRSQTAELAANLKKAESHITDLATKLKETEKKLKDEKHARALISALDASIQNHPASPASESQTMSLAQPAQGLAELLVAAEVERARGNNNNSNSSSSASSTTMITATLEDQPDAADESCT